MGTPLYHAPASNVEAVITIAAVTGVSHEIEMVGFSYDGTPTGGVLTIESPALTVLQKYYVTSSGPGPIGLAGSCLKGSEGSALVVRLTAGGSGVSGSVNCIQR